MFGNKTRIVCDVIFLWLVATPAAAQTGAGSDAAKIGDDGGFYRVSFLRSDFAQVDVVVYVDVKSRELVDQLGGGGCADDKGPGYCLYRLRGEVKEVYKGKVETGAFEFYTVTDASYKPKDRLLGEKVVFLNWSDNYPDKKMSLGTLENSTRDVEHDVLAKMRRIAKRKR